MRAFKLPADGALFLIASLIAGLGHYAFQVLASRRLGEVDFANLSAWHAHLSLGLTLAGLAQYAANFYPCPRARLGRALLGVNLAALVVVLAIACAADPLGPWSIVGVSSIAVLGGWTMGQAQIRLDFRGLALAHLVVAATKLAVPLISRAELSDFTFAIGGCYLPGLWILSWRLRGSRAPAPASAPAWAAPVVLSVAANLIPQFDLLVTRHTLPTEAFNDFARASLFYKGIYFAVFIFAQWLLPRQIRGDRAAARLRWAFSFAVAASLGLAATAPLFAKYVFAWATAPDQILVFAACVHMSLLTLIFLNVQAACAKGALVRAAAPLVALGIEAAAQVALGLPALTYLTAVASAQAVVLVVGLRFHSTRAA